MSCGSIFHTDKVPIAIAISSVEFNTTIQVRHSILDNNILTSIRLQLRTSNHFQLNVQASEYYSNYTDLSWQQADSLTGRRREHLQEGPFKQQQIKPIQIEVSSLRKKTTLKVACQLCGPTVHIQLLWKTLLVEGNFTNNFCNNQGVWRGEMAISHADAPMGRTWYPAEQL